MKTITSFKDLYSFSGFRALTRLKLYPWDEGEYVVTLRRRQKKAYVTLMADGTSIWYKISSL